MEHETPILIKTFYYYSDIKEKLPIDGQKKYEEIENNFKKEYTTLHGHFYDTVVDRYKEIKLRKEKFAGIYQPKVKKIIEKYNNTVNDTRKECDHAISISEQIRNEELTLAEKIKSEEMKPIEEAKIAFRQETDKWEKQIELTQEYNKRIGILQKRYESEISNLAKEYGKEKLLGKKPYQAKKKLPLIIGSF